MSARFRFSGSWWIAAPPARVHAVLVDLERYPQWWPQVVAVASLGEDDARVLCRSALPYTLDLLLHARDRSAEHVEVAVDGDLHGMVAFDLAGVPGGTRLELTQCVTVGGVLGLAARLLRPLLGWNHHRMMRGCIAGLRAGLRQDWPQADSGHQTVGMGR